MSIEDAACLGIVFSKRHFEGDVLEGLKVYEQVRKPRATRVQAASARARENIHERIGLSFRDAAAKDRQADQNRQASRATRIIRCTRSRTRRTS